MSSSRPYNSCYIFRCYAEQLTCKIELYTQQPGLEVLTWLFIQSFKGPNYVRWTAPEFPHLPTYQIKVSPMHGANSIKRYFLPTCLFLLNFNFCYLEKVVKGQAQTTEVKYLDLNGAKLCYEMAGSGPYICLCGWCQWWRCLIQVFTLFPYQALYRDFIRSQRILS
jgi:hypothetical protein